MKEGAFWVVVVLTTAQSCFSSLYSFACLRALADAGLATRIN